MRHSTVEFQPRDYPDPVVAEFLSRVSWLTPDMRMAVGFGTSAESQYSGSRGPVHRLLGRIVARSSAWIGIRAATYGAPHVARDAYVQFWRGLRARGWESHGLAQVALSLQVVRFRGSNRDPLRFYSARLARLVSPTSLGWPEGEALVADEHESWQGPSERLSHAAARRAELGK
jgi:hypothetical protein